MRYTKLLILTFLMGTINASAENIQTQSGWVSGVDSRHESVEVFKGIPYAAPPVGDLRWRPPEPPAAWDGIRTCDKFGAKSLQRKGRDKGGQSEDCLYLNVWAPRDQQRQKRPVMVWIHGGGYTQGSGHQGGNDGTQLARRGVVLVTINYRLGALGFMAHPNLSAESPNGSSGNYAILDQIAALRWVRDNIAHFGGDPHNVTIFGESAGGTSVYLLTATPLSNGLFHRAILESPWLDPKIFRDLNRETENGPPAEFDGVEQANNLFDDSETDVLQKLRALSEEDILEKLKQRWPIVTDRWVFPKPPRQIYADGEQHAVPIIVGTNRDEGTMFAPRNAFGSIDNYKMAITERFGEYADKVLGLYAPKEKSELQKVAVQQITDIWFVQPSREFARAVNRQGAPVWMYHFTKPVWGWMGAAHAAEIGYVFGNLEEPKADDLALSNAFMDYWVQFAKSGDPNAEDLPMWPGYTTSSDKHLVMDAEIATSSGLRREACDLLDEILQVGEKIREAKERKQKQHNAGIRVHRIRSPHQAGDTGIRVLLPDDLEQGKKYPVLYVLPVHEEGVHKHGDGLLEIERLGVHNRHQLICVAPSYTSKPWYADHDLDPRKQDESHLLRTVIPFVEKHYPALGTSKSRMLLGFSKSGWGAMTLLLRNPDVFHRVAAWDPGIRVDVGHVSDADRADRIARNWGTPENFLNYRLSNLIQTQGKKLGDESRIFYYNTEGERAMGGVEIHRRLVENEVPHRYVMEPHRRHAWGSGWLPAAISFLVTN